LHEPCHKAKQWGGQVIAQDEASAEAFQMPRSAIATGDVDAVLSLEQMAPALVAVVRTRMARRLHPHMPISRSLNFS
jgi:chemotaxis response regulator CheB